MEPIFLFLVLIIMLLLSMTLLLWLLISTQKEHQTWFHEQEIRGDWTVKISRIPLLEQEKKKALPPLIEENTGKRFSTELTILHLNKMPKDKKELQTAYHQQMKIVHPDTGFCPSHEKSIALNRAYKRLSQEF